MGKGKKKTKGKKRNGGKKTEGDKDEGGSLWLQITTEQQERARLAASNRIEDPLKNWTRPQFEECPICMLPLPFMTSEVKLCVACGKTICLGCVLGAIEVHRRDGKDRDRETAFKKFMSCPFCREVTTDNILERTMKLANAGQHKAMRIIGSYYFNGERGLPQDQDEGLKWYLRAVEAGSGQAACNVGTFYYNGNGVEQDYEKALEYYQKSAELGYSIAFTGIGYLLMSKGEIEEAMLCFRKAAICGAGDDATLKSLRYGFAERYITKDEYAFTLRENQAACNEMKSGNRDRAKARTQVIVR